MNKWKVSQINDIINPKKLINIDTNYFDYLRVIGPSKRKDEYNNCLFFLTYATKEEIEGEFCDHFDYREKADEIITKNPNFTFVLDEKTYQSLSEKNKNAKLIIVDDILESVNNLYEYQLNNTKAKTIGVTGSVGKTTCVGLIAEVLKKKYKVLRIYSKRITPLILKNNIINNLEEDTDFIALEMSIYHKDHVEILSDLLKPYVSVFLNVDSSHLEYFVSLNEICIRKASIFRYSKYSLYNNLDTLISKLTINNNNLLFDNKFIYKTKTTDFIKIVDNYKNEGEHLKIENKKINLFINTSLAKIQTLTAYKIGKLFNVNEDDIIEAINNYKPVENRIQTQIAFNKEIIFDGDITTNERLKQLSKNNYKKCYLIIRKFGSSEKNKRFEKILEFLDSFTKVYVFDDIEYLDMLKEHKNVKVVNNHDFMKDLEGTIIYHYSGYFRSFNEYNEKNLIELENEIYKIMKRDEQ